MATRTIAKNTAPRRHPPALTPEPEREWPYSISERLVRVRPDGTIVVPATLARLLGAEPGDEIQVRVMADGTLAVDVPGSQSADPASTEWSTTPEKFAEALSATRRPE